MPEDVKVLICSEMPMQDSACILRPRRERTCEYSNDFQVKPYQKKIDQNSYSKNSELEGMLTNEFVVKDWDTYFANAAVRVEEKMNTTKLNWCDRNFKTWVALNRDRIEPHNIIHEVKNQSDGPVCRPPVQKETISGLEKHYRKRLLFEKLNGHKISESVRDHDSRQKKVQDPLSSFSFAHPNPYLPP